MTETEQKVQEIGRLNQDENMSIKDACKQVGISQPTYYNTRRRMNRTLPSPSNGGHEELSVGELQRCQRLIAAQAAILREQGITVEVQ